MTDSTVAPDTDDLDQFNDLFNGKAMPETKEDVTETVTEDTPEEDTPAIEPEEEEEEIEQEEDTSKLKIKPKLTAKERIEQLNAKFREAERRAEEAERRLQEKEGRKTEEKVETKESKEKKDNRPSPKDLNPDGTPKYDLEEYDPKYIEDLADYIVNEKAAAKDRERAIQDAERAEREMREAMSEEWMSRLSEAEERLPDLREKGVALEEVFSSVDDRLGDYLAMTIMNLENGPDVIYYLSDNPAEAKRIVNSGAVAATIALGRLDAMVKPTKQETPRKKVSEAPEPPPIRSRGSGGKFEVAPDTDDQEAFEAMFFRKK